MSSRSLLQGDFIQHPAGSEFKLHIILIFHFYVFVAIHITVFYWRWKQSTVICNKKKCLHDADGKS